MAEKILLELLELAFANKLTASFAREAVKANHNIRVVRLPAGSQFISCGKRVEKVFLVVEGKSNVAKYHKDDVSVVVDVVEPVQLLGLFELLGCQSTYRGSVTAAEDIIAVEIDAEYLRNEVENDMQTARLLLKYTAQMMAGSVMGSPRNVLNGSAQRLVLALHKRCQGKPFPVVLKEGEGEIISRELHLGVNAVQRMLARLRIEGLISIVNGKLTIGTDQFIRINQICMLEGGEDAEA